MDEHYSNYARQHRQSGTSPMRPTASPSHSNITPGVNVPSARQSRRSELGERRNSSRSIPHTGATCENSLCNAPDIPADERLCPGPDGLRLCSPCYKRFKVERRRAREAQRAVTNAWMKPKLHRSKSRTPTDESRNHENVAYTSQTPNSRTEYPTPIEKPYPVYTSTGSPSASLHQFPAAAMDSEDHQNSRPSRNHRSQKQRHYARDASTYEETEFYKNGRVEEEGQHENQQRGCCGLWHRKRKCMIISLGVISAVLVAVIVALAVVLTRKRDSFEYIPSTAQVNNTMAFELGGGTRDSVNDTSIGVGAGNDAYTYYQGNASNFPSKDKWVSFEDMWSANLDTFKHSCGWLKHGDDNTPEMIQDIYNAIQDRANASLVDHRIILATIIQETNGCPLNPPTTSSGGTRNPGLMQSHNGHAYDAKHSRLSILQMIQDGTQGTEHGWGLVDNLNTYGNPYKAMRSYNSGYIPESGNLSEHAGATACYVSDIANRLTGWVRAESSCPDDTH